ncbi:hypothetical protein BJY04DRAFT_199761 [Aspergillus karnatakaensis]|uniref:uncharacterized protein n=1 Tax=Aspergillus karnatakaensis TaxID=1810916 RepID=UPI003CCC9179
MQLLHLTLPTLATLGLAVGAACKPFSTASSTCHDFPASMIEYSSTFQQPEPPILKTEFQTSFIQHKWNANLSHIQVGYIYFSPSQGLVRVDEAYNGDLATSIFNYANTTEEGLVDNTLTSFGAYPDKPTVWRGYVQSNYPLLSDDILTQGDAVFGGLVERELVAGLVAAWNIMYAGIPVTVFVDSCGVLVGYDYFSPGLRTRVTTGFFNTVVGSVKV